ncbi:MAG: hypothetical protein JNJ54_06310 [Myxococcaceae bacterium]|nr:hypothetical protein [Myxococcaceae bacterium]
MGSHAEDWHTVPGLLQTRSGPETDFMIAAVLLSVVSASAGPEKVVVVNLTPSEASLERLAASLSEVVLTELGRSKAISVIGQNDVAAMLGVERQQQLLGCGEAQSSCLAELSGALGAPWLVTGTVARLGSAYRLDLKLLSTADGKAAWRDGQTTRNDSEVFELLATMVKGLVRHFEQSPVSSVSAAPVGPFVLMGAGAVVAITGGVLSALAASQWGALQDPSWRATRSWVEVEQTGSAFNRNVIVGPVLLGAGLAAAAGGLVWWLLGKPAVAVVPAAGAFAVVGSW